jgi:hypothetical protein
MNEDAKRRIGEAVAKAKNAPTKFNNKKEY